MIETLLAYFERKFVVSKDDATLMKSIFLPKKLKKGEFLVREGEVTKYAAFVAKGFLRSYVIDNKGKEHIIQFAPENWWISDKGAGGWRCYRCKCNFCCLIHICVPKLFHPSLNSAFGLNTILT